MAPRRGRSSILVRILGDVDKSLDRSINVAGTALAGLGGIAAVGITKGFTDALGQGANDDLIAARLGISESDAARIGDAAAGAYRNAWGDSLEDVTDTVTGIFTSFDNVGAEQLEDLTAKAEALGQTFELDVGQGVQTASELVESGLVDSADQAFDLLTRGLQEMPQEIRDELLVASNEYGDFFADLGFSGEEAFGALTEFAEGGIFGIDKFGDALKELTIRGTDMSTASVAAYEAAGLSAEDMAGRFLEGGDVARQAIADTVEGLLTIEDPVDQANAAIALFGTPLEDLSTSEIPDFLERLTNMEDGLGDVEGAAERMANQLSDNGRTKLEAFRRRALGGLADFAERTLIPRFDQFIGFVEQNLPAAIAVFDTRVLPVVRRFGDQAVAIFDRVSTWVQDNWPQIEATITGAVDRIETIVSTVLDGLAVAWETWGDNIVTFTERAIGPTIDIISGVVEFLEGVIDFVVGAFTGDWGRAWDGITSIFGGAWDAMTGILDLAWASIRFVVTSIIDGVQLLWDWSFLSDWVETAVDAVVGFFERLPGRVGAFVSAVADAGASIGSAIVDGILDGITAGGRFVGDFVAGIGNALIDLVNTQVIDRINDGIPNSIGAGPFSIDLPDNPIPNLPSFHSGGFVGGFGGTARDIPIIAQSGELVLSRDEVRAIAVNGGRGGDTNIFVTNPMPGVADIEDAMTLARVSSPL